MTKNVYARVVTQPTPQTQPIRGREEDMIANSAGGFSFKLSDPWKRLERFLILGAEGGTYYIKERDLVLENVSALSYCINQDPARTAEMVAVISESGRAFKNDIAMFTLAYMVSSNGAVASAAYAVMPRVVRTGRAFLEFHLLLEKLGVKSSSQRRRVYEDWYTSRKASDLAYQTVKYQTSGTLKHQDLIRYGHVSSDDPVRQNVLNYLMNGAESDKVLVDSLPDIIHGWEKIKRAKTEKEVVAAITQHRLTWEFVPGEWQGKPAIWEALLPSLPYTAMLRNLGRMSSYDMLKAGGANAKFVRERLTSAENLKKARVHPMSLLIAWRTYAAGGEGGKSNLRWTPNSVVRDAVEEGFYLAFDHVEPSGKNIMLGLDVSGSMSTRIGTMPLMCCEVSAVMAMVTLRSEKDSFPMAFDHGIKDLHLSKHDSLEAVLRKVKDINAGGTDCALPIQHALNNGMHVDQFAILTDSETYYGGIHPAEVLKVYRQKTGIDAKMVVVGMLSNGFTIADPSDAGMIDVVGVDPSTPAFISKFAAGL